MFKRNENFKRIPYKKKILGLIFDHFPQSNLSQFNKIVINNVKLKGLGSKNVSVKIKMT